MAHPPQRPQRKASVSSISSSRSRQPRSMRIPSGLTKVSIPSLSLVFAHGDSSLPSPNDISQHLRRPGATSSLSEEALTRQLDRDTGGERMGLRSRRSSSATVSLASRPPDSPSPSVTPDVMEEDEDEERNAEGSQLRVPSETQEILKASTGNKVLNPKSSASWLRWSSPAPSFPKTPSIKGKERQKVEDRAMLPSTDALPTIDPEENSLTSIPDNHQTAAIARPTEIAPADRSLISSSKSTSRGWFSRPSAAPRQMDSTAEGSTSKSITGTAIEPIVAESLPPPATDEQSAAKLSGGDSPENAKTQQEVLVDKSAQTARGWSKLLWGTGVNSGQAPSETTTAPVPSTEPQQTSSESALVEVPSREVTELDQETPSTKTEPAKPQPSVSQAGWSSYLYSIVVPQLNPSTASRSTDDGHSPETKQPRENYQIPEQSSSSSKATASPNSVIESAPPILPETETTSSSRTASPTHRASTTPSTTGWLNYLALRATQKKIGAPSTTTGGSESEPRKSVEEEVMDLDGDPNFPAGGETPKLDDKGKLFKADGKGSMAIRKKRLSTSSMQSNSSPALSSSPRPRSSLEISTTPSTLTTSSLPPPPQAPSVQPNLVIPSFSTTFDRPPRSLPPLPKVEDGKGLTAATTGLAWKALGAVGSYVYSAPKEVDQKETRGKKDGRRIGTDLPRKIGLMGGNEDDGWRDVRRVVVVGVHGWFPAKMLNSVIGEPTGTSTKFANMMGQAVKQFFAEKGMNELRLTTIPLEGEGTIDHRVDKLYKAYLSNPAWINDLRRADAIFFAAHSQGCIVTTHLISRLIAQGHIRTAHNTEAVVRCEWAFGPVGVIPSGGRPGRLGTVGGNEGGRQKVAMLAMCGVHLGPLYSISTSTVIQPYLQWFENAAARELFEFQDTTSAVSQSYQKALSMILENEVRVVLLASLNDQVVPIYGSSFSSANHPLLLRALFVDGASYSASDFMTNLICFAFMLRNAGIDDQGLVEHLSEATAGGLTGVGHSAPYEDPACYSLAVKYLFHAGPAAQPVPPLSVEPFSARDSRNDFELPWIMRALVDSPAVKDLFPGELRDLKEGVISWRPSTKALKEIKKRLEPMAGRQSRLRPLQNSPSSASLTSNATDGAAVATGKSLGLRRDW